MRADRHPRAAAPGPAPRAAVYCNWCGRPTPMDYAHGHAQCVHCKTNIAPCCDGEIACPPPAPRR